MFIFNGYKDISEYKEERRNRVDRQLSNADDEDYLNLDKNEFVSKVMEAKFRGDYKHSISPSPVRLNIPELNFEEWEAEQIGSPGNKSLKVPIKGQGNKELLEVSLDNFDADSLNVNVEEGVSSFMVTFTVDFSGRGSDEVEEEIENNIEKLKEGLEILQNEFSSINEGLKEYAQNQYEERKQQVQEDQDTLDDLDIPVKEEGE